MLVSQTATVMAVLGSKERERLIATYSALPNVGASADTLAPSGSGSLGSCIIGAPPTIQPRPACPAPRWLAEIAGDPGRRRPTLGSRRDERASACRARHP